jgi:hypothetical protein
MTTEADSVGRMFWCGFEVMQTIPDRLYIYLLGKLSFESYEKSMF